jgi:hypothetical protein
VCMSCGCGKPDESHGNDDHITHESLQRAADAAGISLHEAAENIATAADRML